MQPKTANYKLKHLKNAVGRKRLLDTPPESGENERGSRLMTSHQGRGALPSSLEDGLACSRAAAEIFNGDAIARICFSWSTTALDKPTVL